MTRPPTPPDALAFAEPPFAEPWQAQAFALAMALHEAGLFTRAEWSAALGARRKAAGPAGDAHYYEHWLAALEGLVVGKGVAAPEGLVALREAWRAAYAATPHGQPVALGARPQEGEEPS